VIPRFIHHAKIATKPAEARGGAACGCTTWRSPYPASLTLLCIDFALSHDHQRPCLWRVVDQDGNVLDILLQRRQDKKAVMKLFRKLLRGLAYVLRAIITDKLKTYGTVKREILFSVEHRQ
jgi:hypothetical protein